MRINRAPHRRSNADARKIDSSQVFGATHAAGCERHSSRERTLSTLRSILLHIDASPRSAKRLALAHELTARHGARVTALYASTPTALSLPFVMGQGAAEMLPMLQQLDTDYRDNAKALFDRAEAAATAPLCWTELRESPLIPAFAHRALCADLLIVGQHDANDLLTAGVPSDFVPCVVMASGRPALVVPYVDIGTTFGQQVLIAWKPTRESAHAVSAAIPFLQHAQRLHLTIADDSAEPVERGRALEDYLRSHEVQAPIQHHAAVPSDDPGDGLLSLAADVGADLLVMGCYGHSRARELVLGGVTRTVLRSMTLPVLMAH
jgi:nucleotide-binding universal stress UspA family protein